jgi:hypothetical protein
VAVKKLLPFCVVVKPVNVVTFGLVRSHDTAYVFLTFAYGTLSKVAQTADCLTEYHLANKVKCLKYLAANESKIVVLTYANLIKRAASRYQS